jgi:hypothetical protein
MLKHSYGLVLGFGKGISQLFDKINYWITSITMKDSEQIFNSRTKCLKKYPRQDFPAGFQCPSIIKWAKP